MSTDDGLFSLYHLHRFEPLNALCLTEGRGVQAAGRPDFVPGWTPSPPAVPQAEPGDPVPHSQATGTV